MDDQQYPGRRLSPLGEAILKWVYREERSWRDDIWGVPWRPSRVGVETRTAQAVVSRAVQRLERRGLLIRQSQRSGPVYRRSVADPAPRRATHLLLTGPGRELAERLTTAETNDVSRDAEVAA